MVMTRPNHFFVQRGNLLVLSPRYWTDWYHNDRTGKDPARSAWGNPTKLMVEEIARVLPDLRGKQVSDMAAGDGRWSLFFAGQGAEVRHVDSSPGANHWLGITARAMGATTSNGRYTSHRFDQSGMVTEYEADVIDYTKGSMLEHPNKRDIVFCSGLMEYLSPQEVAWLVRVWQQQTAVGGIHVIVYLAKGTGVADIPGEHPHEAGSVESFYSKGWRMMFNADDYRPDTHVIITPEDRVIAPDREPETHQHRIMRFIAMKTDV